LDSQAAEFAKIHKELKLEVSYDDPCLYYQDDKHDCITLVIHINDCYGVGDQSTIKTFLNKVYQKGLKPRLNLEQTIH
jgi:hypothetical protein